MTEAKSVVDKRLEKLEAEVSEIRQKMVTELKNANEKLESILKKLEG